jgi:hypothetical protein
VFDAAFHIPPAFWQSARFVILLRSVDLPAGGLADGEVVEPLDEPPPVPGDFIVSAPDELPEPVVPEGLEPEDPGFEPLPVCAAASAGARATRAIRSISMSLCIGFPPLSVYRQVHS